MSEINGVEISEDQMSTVKVTDPTALANSVSEHIKYEMNKDFLIKPLDPVMVQKEFTEPVPAEDQKGEDKNGIDAVDYSETKTEVREVESDFARGVVLKVPHEYKDAFKNRDYAPMEINVGDTIIYQKRFAKYFDLYKDTQLIKSFDIIAVER